MAKLGSVQIAIAFVTVTLFSACGARLSSPNTPFGPTAGDPTSKPTAPVARGSQVVVCVDDNGKVISTELLDFVEGQQRFKLTPFRSTTDLTTQTSHLLDVIANGVGDPGEGTSSIRLKLQTAAHPFLDPSSKIRHHETLAVTETPGVVKLGKGCSLQQLVRTETSNGTATTIVNADLFDQLSPTSQAAAIAHEALATYLEKFGETSSNRIRAFIAEVGSGQTFAPIAGVLSPPFVECTNQTTDALIPSSHLYFSQNARGVSIFAEEVEGVPRLGEGPLSKDGTLDDLTSDTACPVERISKFPLPFTNLAAGHFYASDTLFQVCNLGQVSVYVANQNGNLANLVRRGFAHKLKCVSKSSLGQ